MSTFLYFTEQGNSPVNRQRAESLGVGYAFDQSPTCAELQGRTPSGGKGWLFADVSRLNGQKLGYNADSQTWRKIPKTDVYIGYYNEHKPTPADLTRTEQLIGREITLNGGSVWQVPLLRYFADDVGFMVALPVVAGLDDDGEWISQGTTPEHDDLNALADRLLESVRGQTLQYNKDGTIDETTAGDAPPPMTDGEMLEGAVLLLGANYRVSKIELAQLGALQISNQLIEFGRIAIDLDTVEAWIEKKNADSAPVAGDG